MSLEINILLKCYKSPATYKSAYSGFGFVEASQHRQVVGDDRRKSEISVEKGRLKIEHTESFF